MQTPVTVVMLLHDTATEKRPAGLQGAHRVQLAGDAPHLGLRRPPEGGAYPPPACAGLSALSPVGASAPGRKKAAHWTLKRGGKLLCGAVRSLTEAEYATLEKTHICCTVADVSDDRGVPLPHFHVEGS